MTALITGASEGMGREMALILSDAGYDLVLSARNRENLEKTAQQCKGKTRIIPADLSDPDQAKALYAQLKDSDIDLVINNAGVGAFGRFQDTDLDRELSMIDLNIKSLHILTKLFLRDFLVRDAGSILNVASLAAFVPGPMHAAYYASKTYVLHLTEAIYEELRQQGSRVYIGAFCPGPVRTGFNDRAGAGRAVTGIDARPAAEYAIRMMNRKKLIIMPDWKLRVVCFVQRLLPVKVVLRMTALFQKMRKHDN